jgi:hypothetical protein
MRTIRFCSTWMVSMNLMRGGSLCMTIERVGIWSVE